VIDAELALFRLQKEKQKIAGNMTEWRVQGVRLGGAWCGLLW
jgi:hypothetical protein